MSIKKHSPIPLSFEVVSGMVKELGSLKFFPREVPAQLAIVRLVASMCEFEHQLRWLIDRMTAGTLFTEWPGPRELRACYCSKFKPQDGLEIGSQIYLDGIPSETGRQEFEPAQLSAGEARKLLAQFAIAPKELPAPEREPRAESNPNPNPRNAEQSLKASVAAKAELSDTDKPEERGAENGTGAQKKTEAACLIQKP